jgi:hypothetical protein
MNHSSLITSASTIFILLFAQALHARSPIDPGTACSFLNEDHFRGSMEYSRKKSGYYNCSSLRKPINKGEPTGSDIRYEVRGTESEVTGILLHLRMRSHRISIPVLKEFHRNSETLYQKVFNKSLPEEISIAITSAIRGEWAMDGYKIQLNRLHDNAMTYELIFSIEK